MKKWIVLALLSVTLAACGGPGDEPNPPTKVAEVVEEKEFKPIPYKETKADGVCSANGGFKSCYGLAFECNDGAKIKPEKASCMDGNYVDDTNEKTNQADEKLVDAKLYMCEEFANAAKVAMSARQKAIPKTDAMAIAKKNPIVASLVEEAYKHPIMETEALRKNTIALYENKMHRQCLDIM